MNDERDYEDDFEGEVCPECGDGEYDHALQSACIDDLCHGGEVPCAIHGDWSSLPCSLCGKTWT